MKKTVRNAVLICAVAFCFAPISSNPAHAFWGNLTKTLTGGKVSIPAHTREAAVAECSQLHAARLRDPLSLEVISHKFSDQKRTDHGFSNTTLRLDATATNGYGGKDRDIFRCNVTVGDDGELIRVVRRY